MKEKAKAILMGNSRGGVGGGIGGSARPDSDFQKLLDIPDSLDDHNRSEAFLGPDASTWEMEMASEIRMRASAQYASRKRGGEGKGKRSDDQRDGEEWKKDGGGRGYAEEVDGSNGAPRTRQSPSTSTMAVVGVENGIVEDINDDTEPGNDTGVGEVSREESTLE